METIKQEIKLLTEQIALMEREDNRTELINEMKTIGIDKLPYAYASLKRFIDEKTMNIHYNKHYKGYVKKLNKAIANRKVNDMSLENIVKSISRFDKSVRNNAGGAFNHALFWKMLSPNEQKPFGDVLLRIKKDFGSYNNFKNEFEKVATDRFGSGWAWLVLTNNGKLKVMSTANQDNPLMNVVDGGGYPLLGLDLWEHAYYLKYQNKRDEYIKNFWKCVNWEFVNKLFESQKTEE